MLFERNLMELSSLAARLPRDACKHPEVSNVTMTSNATTYENVTTPSPDASKEDDDDDEEKEKQKQKHKKKVSVINEQLLRKHTHTHH